MEFRALGGDIARALGRLAETLQAELIVVGSRRGGLRSSVHEFLGGSVAVHLARSAATTGRRGAADPEPGRSAAVGGPLSERRVGASEQAGT